MMYMADKYDVTMYSTSGHRKAEVFFTSVGNIGVRCWENSHLGKGWVWRSDDLYSPSYGLDRVRDLAEDWILG